MTAPGDDQSADAARVMEQPEGNVSSRAIPLLPDWQHHGVAAHIARLWLQSGGEHHGPRTETVSMPMANLMRFVQAVTTPFQTATTGDAAVEAAERDACLYGNGFYRTRASGSPEYIPLAEITILRSRTPAEAAISQIASMKLFPDDKINRMTLLAAIRLANLAAKPPVQPTDNDKSREVP